MGLPNTVAPTPPVERLRERLAARRDDRVAQEGGGGDRRVVDHPVDDHLGRLRRDLDGVRGDLGDLPGELALAGEVLLTAMNSYLVLIHGAP
jgi:hypothetical protein